MRYLRNLIVLLVGCVIAACSGSSNTNDSAQPRTGERQEAVVLPTTLQDAVASGVVESQPVGGIPGSGRVTPTGAFEYTIPIKVPRGRNGLQPHLALIYNSNAGDGPMGRGWSLAGLSSITRCRKTIAANGIAGGVDFDDSSDQFCLDGQPLILIEGSPGEEGAVYVTERTSFERIEITRKTSDGIRSFTVQGQDGRIRTYGETDAPWADLPADQAYADDALVRGPRAEGAEVNGHPGIDYTGHVTLAWKLSRVNDRSGNWIMYGYHTDAPDEDSPDPAEPFFSHRLEAIAYGVHEDDFDQGGWPGPAFAIYFDYEIRADPSLTAVSGLMMLREKRLDRIRVMANPSLPGGRTTPQWEYRFEYLGHSDGGLHTQLLKSVRYCDGSSDDPDAVCLQPTVFHWTVQASAWRAFTDSYERIPTGITDITNEVDDTMFLTIDVNGDGRDDLVYQTNGTDEGRVRLGQDSSDGDPFGDPIDVTDAFWNDCNTPNLVRSRPIDHNGDGSVELLLACEATPGQGYILLDWAGNDFTAISGRMGGLPPPEFPAIWADMDGDGLPDLGLSDAYGDLSGKHWTFHRYDHSAGDFGPLMDPGAELNYTNRLPAVALDVDGDGRTEVVATDPNSYDPLVMDLPSRDAGLPSTSDIRFVAEGDATHSYTPQLHPDVNGDGLKDIVSLYMLSACGDETACIQFNMGGGQGFTERVPAGDFFPINDSSSPFLFDHGYRVADLNADGRDDILVYSKRVGMPLAFLSDGARYIEYDLPHPLPVDKGATGYVHFRGWLTAQLGDFNGDGMLDMAQLEQEDGDPTAELFIYQQRNRPIAITNVIRRDLPEDEQGASHLVSYAPLSNSNVYEPGDSCEFPQKCLKRGLWVVQSHQQTAATGFTHDNKTTYKYFDARVDLQGRGSLGFSRVVTTNEQRQSVRNIHYDNETRRTFDVDGDGKVDRHIYPFAGRISTEDRTRPDDIDSPSFVLRSESHFDYEVAQHFGGAAFAVRLRNRETFEFDSLELFRQTSETRSYDEFDNLTTRETNAVQYIDGNAVQGDRTKIVTEYENRSDTWLIGLPSRVTRSSFSPGAGTWTDRISEFGHDDAGFLSEVTEAPGDPDLELFTELQRNNPYGVVDKIVQQDVTNPSADHRVTQVYYDNNWLYPERVVNSLGHETWIAHHPIHGAVLGVQDANGAVITRTIDTLGRLRSENRADGSWTTYDYEVPEGNIWATQRMAVRQRAADGSEMVTTYGMLGHETARRWLGPDGNWVETSTYYDDHNRIETTTNPDGATHYVYDNLDRPLEIEYPNDTTKRWEYPSFFEVRQFNEEDDERRLTFDAHERLVSSTSMLDSEEVTTEYVWGHFGQLSGIHDPEGNTTGFGYDARGNPSVLVDGDAGINLYGHNAFGEVEASLLSGGGLVFLERDALGRVVGRYSDNGAAEFHWDTAPNGIGRLDYSVSEWGVQKHFEYTEAGQVQTLRKVIAGDEYVTQFGYDSIGRLERYGLGGLFAKYAYNSVGVLNRVFALEIAGGAETELWHATEWDWRDRPTQVAQGPYDTATTFNPLTGRVSAIQTTKSQNLVNSTEYDYFNDGNVHHRINAVSSRTEEFSYDDMDRLTRWQVPSLFIDQEYHYSDSGNLIEAHTNTAFGENSTYGYNGVDGGPHGATSITTAGGTTEYFYDDGGRIQEGPFTWVNSTWFDLPEKIINILKIGDDITFLGPRATFEYDADQQRARRVTQDGADTRYVSNFLEHRITPSNPDGEYVYHFFANGQEVAEAIRDGGGPETGVRQFWHVFPDALGSVDAIGDGTVEQRTHYTPFGRRIDDVLYTPAANPFADVRQGFTGHEHDETLGLINMNGRIYDPTLRSFWSPDPIVAAPLNGQSWNPYSYVMNNPLRYVDPSGFDWLDSLSQGPGYECGPPECPAQEGGHESGSDEGASGDGGGGADFGTIKMDEYVVHAEPWKPREPPPPQITSVGFGGYFGDTKSDWSGYMPSTLSPVPGGQVAPPAATPAQRQTYGDLGGGFGQAYTGGGFLHLLGEPNFHTVDTSETWEIGLTLATFFAPGLEVVGLGRFAQLLFGTRIARSFEAAAARALPAAVRIPAGNLKAGMEHILRRHAFNTVTTKPASKFAQGMGHIEIRGAINEAVRSGASWQVQGGSRVLETILGRTIGTDLAGNATSGIRVVTDSAGSVITAYPIPIP